MDKEAITLTLRLIKGDCDMKKKKHLKETVYEADKTVPDGATDKTVLDGAADKTALDNQTVLDGTVKNTAPFYTVKKGALLLDIYRVESDAIEGGMGKVWRVRHAGWGVNLAMKQPKAALFQSQHQKDNFIHECEAWIGLGLHPHIVSCYYVREINGIPTIFSEWMDGGSLKNAIESGRLYEESHSEQRKRILDIAIQFARGLHYAHECRDESGNPKGLIHQDVKPDNLLLTKDGEAKVADFGISKARAVLTMPEGGAQKIADGETMYSASGGYTPAYCSMEQMNGQQLTRRTDIYSWAVSVMEMYLGDRPWANGVIAGAACESYFPKARVAIPKAMKVLLKECLHKNEKKRPHDFSVVEKRLLTIYREETGSSYPRPVSKAAMDTADSLNNRALSFLDLGKPEEAERCWKKALGLDANHIDAVYNHALHLWRSGKSDDTEAIRLMETCCELTGSWKALTMLARMHVERSDYQSAQIKLYDALKKAGNEQKAVNEINDIIGMIKPGGYAVQYMVDGSSMGLIIDPQHSRMVLHRGQELVFVRISDGNECYAIHFDDLFIIGNSIAFIPGNGQLCCQMRRNSDDIEFYNRDSAQCSYKLTNIARQKYLLPSADGKYLFIIGFDGVIKKLDIKTGEEILTFEGPLGSVESASMSTDGRYLVVTHSSKSPNYGLFDECFPVWDAQTGKYLRTLEGHKLEWFTDKINSVVFLPDGKRVLSGGSDMVMKLWNVENGCCEHDFVGHKYSIEHISLSKNAAIAVSTDKTCVKLWDLKSKKCLCTLTEPEGKGSLYGARIVGNSIMISVYMDGGSKLITKSMPVFGRACSWLLSEVSAVNVRLALETEFREVYADFTRKMALKDIPGAFEAYKWASSISGFEGAPESWKMNAAIAPYCFNGGFVAAKAVTTMCQDNDMITGLRMTADGRYMLTWGDKLALWDYSGRELIRKFIGHVRPTLVFNAESQIYSADISPCGKYIASGGNDNTLRLWDPSTGENIRTSEQDNAVCCVRFIWGGRRLITANWDGLICIYDTISGSILGKIQADVSHGSFGLSYGEDLLALGTNRTSIDVISMERRTLLHSIDMGKTSRYSEQKTVCTDVSPDGRFVITADEQAAQGVRLWNLKDGSLMRRLDGHTGNPSDVCFSPDGRFALSSSFDKTVKLWEIESGKCLFQFKNKDIARGIAFTPDMQNILIADVEGIINVWSIFWEAIFPGWADWDEGAMIYLRRFAGDYPNWSDADFGILIACLRNRGYGWLKPDSVKAKLKKMAGR